jgi:hypothetical protein
LFEVDKVNESQENRDKPSWELNMCEFEDGDWEQLVESHGDFAAIGLELTATAPVDRFTTFWRETRLTPLAEPPEGMAFKSPLRFVM